MPTKSWLCERRLELLHTLISRKHQAGIVGRVWLPIAFSSQDRDDSQASSLHSTLVLKGNVKRKMDLPKPQPLLATYCRYSDAEPKNPHIYPPGDSKP